MKLKIPVFTIILLYITLTKGLSQVIVRPNYALKSHETLDITSVEITPTGTQVNLTIENRIDEGTFCADRNIYLLGPAGEKLALRKSTGIPVCPGSYKFKSIGEKLHFTLEFPPLKAGTNWCDLVEDCNDNCFSFYGVTLDNNLNKKLDEAFALASKGTPADNIILFSTLLNDIDNQNLGIEGLLYINIINAALENEDKVNTIVWYRRLADSKAPRAKQYIKYLNDKGIKY